MKISKRTLQRSGRAAELEQRRRELATKILARVAEDGAHPTAIRGLVLSRRSAPTACNSAAYNPALVVFVQGEKLIRLGEHEYHCDETSFLLTSVDLPVVSQILKASPSRPLVGLLLKLEMPLVRQTLRMESGPQAVAAPGARGMAMGRHTVELLDACTRLVDLLGQPQDIPFLGNLIQREILYRVLQSPQGGHLRAIATLGDQSHRTARAIAWIKANYAQPLRVEELAELAQMGVSTFHHHFRQITAMSPLQYQKRLRLHVARERMLVENLDAASAAFAVGYESASQFSREYRRVFGQPPMRDVRPRRLAG